MKAFGTLILLFSMLSGAAVARRQLLSRKNPFQYLDRHFLQNEQDFLKNYHDFRNRNLATKTAPLLVSNAQFNESPANIQQDIQEILRQNNITGAVVVITNFETLPTQPVVSKFEVDGSPYRHPYYYNPEVTVDAPIDTAAATKQIVGSQSPYANLVFPPAPITFRDIPTIMVIANSVTSIYTYFSSFIPGNNNVTTAKSTLDKIQNALILYAKVRVLIKTFVQKRDQIAQQVSFLGSHLMGLQTSEMDMISFYGQEGRYFTLKTASMKFQNDTRGAKIRGAWSSISTEAINFDFSINQVVNATVQLIQTAMTFDDTVKALNGVLQTNARRLGLLDFLNDPNILTAVQQSSVVQAVSGSGLIDTLMDTGLVQAIKNSTLYQKIANSDFVKSTLGNANPLEILKSIDTVMMGLVKLVASRQQTNNALTNLRTGLTSLKEKYDLVSGYLVTIQSEVDRLNTENLLTKSVSRLGVWLLMLVALLFKW